MQHTLVAVFDNRNDAQQAMDELLASSFTGSDVRLSQADPTGHTDSLSGTPTMPASTNDDDSIASSIRNFFSDIFGTDDSVHAQRYSSAVTRGHHVLTVGPVSEPEVERAADIVERFGPIDIDEDSSGADYGSAGTDQIMRRDSATLQGSQSMSLQNDDRLPFQQGNLNDAVPMGGTYQEPMGNSGNLGTQSLSSATQQGSFQRGDLGSSSGAGNLGGSASGSSGVGNGGAAFAPTEIKRPGVRVFARDYQDPDPVNSLDKDSANRSHWSSTYGSDSGSFDDYAPAYSYGSTLASDDKYRGRSWDDAESDIRSGWDARNGSGSGISSWDKVKAAVRHGWDRITK